MGDENLLRRISKDAEIPENIAVTKKLQAMTREELLGLAGALSKDNLLLSSIISNLPAGICEAAYDDFFTLLYGNVLFFQLYGYTPEQLKIEHQNQIGRIILPEDLPEVKKAVKKAFDAGAGGFEVEHRIARRDGNVVWALIKGNFFRGPVNTTLHCVCVDITQRRQMEQELKINEERFRIALAQMDNTIFDYNIATRMMIHAYKSAEVYGLPKEMENVPDSLVENGTIHPGSVSVFLEMYRKIRGGAPHASCIVQTRLAAGRYVWRKITLTNIYDAQGSAVRAIGILEDIDEQKRREELLRNQIERDTLTGLYNKGATEEHIRGLMGTGAAQGEYDALFIIDIDDFKGVNDRYGHLYGDKVLAESARRIASLFYPEDIIGRIGGDEFAVFLKKIPGRETIRKKAERICKAFNGEFNYNGIIAAISCSVGTAAFPADGTTFETLYQKADIALYKAKLNGKNRFCAYREEMGPVMQWKPRSNTVIDKSDSLED